MNRKDWEAKYQDPKAFSELFHNYIELKAKPELTMDERLHYRVVCDLIDGKLAY